MEVVRVDHMLTCWPLGYIDLSPRHLQTNAFLPEAKELVCDYVTSKTVNGTLSKHAASPVLRAVFLLPRRFQTRAPRIHANAQTDEFLATEILAFFSLNPMFVSHFHYHLVNINGYLD